MQYEYTICVPLSYRKEQLVVCVHVTLWSWFIFLSQGCGAGVNCMELYSQTICKAGFTKDILIHNGTYCLFLVLGLWCLFPIELRGHLWPLKSEPLPWSRCWQTVKASRQHPEWNPGSLSDGACLVRAHLLTCQIGLVITRISDLPFYSPIELLTVLEDASCTLKLNWLRTKSTWQLWEPNTVSSTALQLTYGAKYTSVHTAGVCNVWANFTLFLYQTRELSLL